MTHARQFDIEGTTATIHPCKSDKNTHVLDFSSHVATIRALIQQRKDTRRPKLVIVEGKPGNGISYLVEVLAGCLTKSVRIQGDSSDYVVPKINPGNTTYIFDGAYRIDSFSLSALLDKITDTGNTAILLVHHYSEVQVPAELYTKMVHLKLTREGLIEGEVVA